MPKIDISSDPLVNDLQNQALAQQQTVQQAPAAAPTSIFRKAATTVAAPIIGAPAATAVAGIGKKGKSWDKPNLFQVIFCSKIVLILLMIETALFMKMWYLFAPLDIICIVGIISNKMLRNKLATICGVVSVIGAVLLPILLIIIFGWKVMNPFAK